MSIYRQLTVRCLAVAALFVGAAPAWAQQTHVSNTGAPGKSEPVNVQAPNVASLGSFGNPTVSQFTGAANIEVPLYTVQEGAISVPVTLAYNATGFRPDEHPGWVGMGWGLRAGGVISRVVNRIPDELNESGSSSMWPVYGFYFTNQILRPSTGDWTSRSFLETTIANRMPNPSFADTEPDEFSFTLPGCSGTFYKDSDGDNNPYGSLLVRGGWRVKCDQPVKVTVNNPADPFLSVPFPVPNGGVNGASFYKQYYNGVYPKTFAGFTLTTADGTRYVFGHNEGSAAAPADRPAIEYSIGLFSQLTDYWTASAWYLTKIITPDGNQVTLNYEREAAGAQGRFIDQMYNSINEQLQTQASNNGGWLTQSCSSNHVGNNSSVTILNSMAGKLVAPVYLRSIVGRTTELAFTRSLSRELRYEYYRPDPTTTRADDVYRNFAPRANNGAMGDSNYPFLEKKSTVGPKLSFTNSLAQLQWEKLDAISIKSQGQLLRSWQFKYNDNASVSDATAASQRLTLLQVAEVGNDGTAKPAYQFGYTGLQQLPDYLWFVSDHWGFYNNVTNEAPGANGAVTPNIPDYNNLSSYYATRNPNTSPGVYLRGLLTSIKYPTGGTTTLEYEQHRYGSRVDTLRTLLDPGQTGSLAAGGVRLKRVTSATVSNPQPGDQVVTEYYYVKNYVPGVDPAQLPSSGILNAQIKYTYSNRVYEGAGNNSTVHYAQSMFSSQPLLPASGNSQGGHVGYSQVVEKRSDGSYTKYFFSNFDQLVDTDNQNTVLDNGHFDEPPLQSLETNKAGTLVYDQFSSRAQERGRLLQQADFTAGGSCVKRHRTTYAAFDATTDYARYAAGRQLNVCTTFAALQGITCKLNTYAYLPTSVVTTEYGTGGTGGVSTTTSYTYTSYQGRTINLPVEESTQDGKGQTLTTDYIYAFNVSGVPSTASDPVVAGLVALTNLNQLSAPVEVRSYRNGQLTSAVVQTYTLPSTTAPTAKPYQRWQLELDSPLPGSQYTTAYISGASGSLTFVLDPKLKLDRTCTTYDARGNCIGMQTAGQVNTTYTWDYGKTLPVSETHNATPTQVVYAGFEADCALDPVTFATVDPLAWSYDPRPGLSTHLQRGSGGITGRGFYRLDGGWGVGRSNLPSGDYELSFWAKGGLPNIWVFTDQELSRSEGPANAQGYKLVRFRVRITSGGINIDAYGRQVDIDDVRLYPVGAQMTSYTHDPGTGVTSISDAANRPVLYEFDGLQRLHVQRDAEGNITKHLEYHYQQ